MLSFFHCIFAVCPAGQLQAALTAYKAALRDNPTDPLLYSNIAAVQLRLGNINEVCEELGGLAKWDGEMGCVPNISFDRIPASLLLGGTSCYLDVYVPPVCESITVCSPSLSSVVWALKVAAKKRLFPAPGVIRY